MFDFFRWRDTTVPYRPGSAHTQPFGIRTIEIGNPLHLGNDRGARPPEILSPFDGELEWSLLPGTVAGSLLTIIPKNAINYVELQVMHAEARSSQITYHGRSVSRGEELPVIAGDVGLSTGPHTHTELVVRSSVDLLDRLREQSAPIYVDEIVNNAFLWNHCAEYGFDVVEWKQRITRQAVSWGITEMTDKYAVRTALPDYRIPHWGRGATIHINPQWALDI